MNRLLHYAVFAAGLVAVCWVGVGYIGTNALALCITLLIAAFYLMGAVELHRFHQATASLTDAMADLSSPPEALGPWLDRLDPSLRNAVRLRVEGERVGLPGPVMTPYLAGLLVLLGMLGTFLGMVVTLKGTGLALESATDLQAIRDSLSAPVKGLGLAFGTSVAGVATSAMLGLVSALCRRERLQAGQMLDTKTATTLRVYSQVHHREQSFKLLERQASVLPELVDQLKVMMAAMDRQSQALSERLIASQDQFHSKAEAAYGGLAASVGESLERSLTASAHAAGATIQPVVEATMAGIARETASLQGTMAQTVQQQLDGLSARFETTATGVAATWTTALAEHRTTNEAMSSGLRASLGQFATTFEQRSAALAADTQQILSTAATRFSESAASLVDTVGQAHAELQTDIATHDAERLSAWTQSLGSMAASLQQEWQQAGVQAADLQRELASALAATVHDMASQNDAQARSAIAETARVLQAATEAPKAATDLIAELREKLSDSMARDNTMLDERARILDTLGTLLEAVNHAFTEQRVAVDVLVAGSADMLDQVGSRFTDKVDAQTDKLVDVAAQVTVSAVEVASLGEAFGHAVQLFSESTDKLTTHLQRIEGALGKSISRGDEQLAYYVAQAREVIDLSTLSQKQIIEELQHFASRQVAQGSEA
jgi:hypothetical protein